MGSYDRKPTVSPSLPTASKIPAGVLDVLRAAAEATSPWGRSKDDRILPERVSKRTTLAVEPSDRFQLLM